MLDHKGQSRTGEIPVDFSVACVSYNLYDRIRVNCHDPEIEDVPYDSNILGALTREYYSGFLSFLNKELFKIYESFTYENERFFKIGFRYDGYGSQLFPQGAQYCIEEFFYRFRLILPEKLKYNSKEGITKNLKPFESNKKGLQDLEEIPNSLNSFFLLTMTGLVLNFCNKSTLRQLHVPIQPKIS